MLNNEQLSWIADHEPIKVGIGFDWLPFEFVDNNDIQQGISIDYLKLLEKKTGLTFDVSAGYWSENLALFEQGQLDLLPAVYRTPERTRFMRFSQSYFSVLDYIFIRQGIQAETFSELAGLRIAVPVDSAYKQILTAHFPFLETVSVSSLNEAIDFVLEGKAELLVNNYGALTYKLRQENINTIIPFKSIRYQDSGDLFMVTQPDNEMLSSIIRLGLALVTKDEKQQIYDKWFSPVEHKPTASLGLTNEEKLWLKAHPVIRVGSDINYPPYEFINEHGQFDGVTVDLLKLIEQKLAIKFNNTTNAEWSETLRMTRDKQIDVLTALVSTPQRQEYLSFTDNYDSPPNVIISRKNTPTISSVADLKSKIVAVESNYFTHDVLTSDYPEIRVKTYDNTQQALMAVSNGLADAYIGNYVVANWVIDNFMIPDLKVDGGSGLADAELRIGVRKDWPIFTSILNKVIASISDEKMAELNRKWLVSGNKFHKLILSEDEKQWLQQHKHFTFVGDPNWLPYEAFDKNGAYIGIVADYLDIIQKELGIKIDIISTQSWEESVNLVKQGKVDIISETNDSDLQEILSFTESYLTSPIVLVMDSKNNYVESIDQIQHKKIAVIREYGYLPKIYARYPNIEFEVVDSIQSGLTAVSTGKVDALIVTLAQASYHIPELGIHNVRIVGETGFHTSLALGVSEQYKPLIPLINRVLETISQQQKNAILGRWGKGHVLQRINYELVSFIILIFLIVVAVILFWNRKLASEISRRNIAEQQTQTLIDHIPLQIIVTNLEGKILTINPQVSYDYKVNKADIGHFNIGDLYHDAQERQALLLELKQKGSVDQKIVKFRRLNGQIRSMMVSVLPIKYHDNDALLSIAIDMTERLDIERQLVDAKELAEMANRSKSEFLANMSHEIRTPMNAIVGFTELLKEQVKDSKLKSFVKTIQSASQDLLLIINDILDLSKIEAGKLEITKVASNPHKLFSEIGQVFMLVMKNKGIELILDVDPAIPKGLVLDVVRLRQVLLNLIGNAVKFTEKGHIKLVARTEQFNPINSQLDLLIDIQDTGIGIPPEQLKTIFDEFKQTTGQDQAKFGGTGLGLTISKRLVELMNGDIYVESDLNAGSTFTISLRQVAVATFNEHISDQKDNQVNEVVFEPAKILVVDDVEHNRSLITESFYGSNITVFEADNGQAAVDWVNAEQVDLILMDLRMPVMDGYRAAEMIKGQHDIPIIALTASVMKEELDSLKQQHFDDYLRKPVLRKHLRSLLAKYLTHRIETVELHDSSTDITLSDSERSSIPLVLVALEPSVLYWNTIKDTNNLAEMKVFAEGVKEVGLHYQFDSLASYAETLLHQIDVFDIDAINVSMHYFSELHQYLVEQDN